MTSSATARSRVLFFSDVPIGAQLTGPAIRTLELARQVSRVAEVTIAAYGSIERETPGLTPRCFTTEREVLELAQAHEAFVAQGFFTLKYTKLLLSDRVKIFDLYDPLTLETLEHGRHIPLDQRRREYAMIQSVVHGQLATGDFFLCANERQRDYYLGLLANAGRLNPISYDVADRDLRHLLAVVPMGLSAAQPTHTRSVLRGVHPAIKADDFVL
ncbi:MAG TPA: hypothetical protein VLG46_09770, partial [Anaerolineae bacterium]|nr:hypothetical protein [Anaerolineae bacterium]